LKEKAKPEVLGGVTAKSILATVIIFIIFIPFSLIGRYFTDRPETFYGYPMTFLVMVSIFYALGKLGPRLQFTPQEFAVVYAMTTFIGGSRILMWWGHTEQIWPMFTMSWAVFALGLNSNPTVWGPLVPDHLFPTANREKLLGMFMNGISPGEAFPLTALATPLLIYSIFAWLLMCLSMAIVWGIIGYSWANVERITFINALPTMMVTRWGLEDRSLWGFKGPMKVFWAVFIFGIIAAGTPLILEVFPAIPVLGAFEFGWFQLRIFPFMPSVLPGAMGYGWMNWVQILMGLVVPTEILTSCVINYVAFGVIYNAIALQAGWYVSYTPGDELSNMWGLPWEQAPISFSALARGAMLALGATLLFMSRDRIRMLADALRGKDTVELGLSMRFVSILGIASFIVFWILLSALGLPVIMGLMWIIMYVLWHLMTARGQATYADHPFELWQFDWKVMKFTGAGLGYWPATASADQVWFLTRSVTYGHSSWIPRCGAWWGIAGLAPIYKMASEFKINLKHLTYLMFGVMIIGLPTIFFSQASLAAHVGYLNTNMYSWQAGHAESMGVTSLGLTPGASLDLEVTWLGVGVIYGILLYALKTFVPALPYDPFMMAISLCDLEWWWLMALFSLVIKLVLMRIVGAETFTRYALYAMVGGLAGYGVVFTVTSFINFGMVGLPTFLTRYVP